MTPLRKLVTPPGIEKAIKEFEAHLEAARSTGWQEGLLDAKPTIDDSSEPILITGDSGVGKTQFIEVFKEYEISNGRPSPKVIDCSIFIGADSNMAKSALFGHEKGAFTGADTKKIGLIATAAKEGRAIVLDEIGELPQEVQAMILIFIESGKYFPLGAEKEKTSHLQIIGVTNREKKLRKELRYRFFSFRIPSLHERRGDILHYFAWFFYDIFKHLRSDEILSLLLYNWPGNVREIKQVGLIVRRVRFAKSNALPKANALRVIDQLGLYSLKKSVRGKSTSFSPYGCLYFFVILNQAGINLIKLNNLIMQAGIGYRNLDEKSDNSLKEKPFNLKLQIWNNNKLAVEYRDATRHIDIAFNFLCYILSLDCNSKKDLSRVTKRKKIYIPDGSPVFHYAKKFGVDVTDIQEKVQQDIISFEKKTSLPDLTRFSYDELQKEYHQQIRDKTTSLKEAVKISGINEGTLRGRYKKLGINERPN